MAVTRAGRISTLCLSGTDEGHAACDRLGSPCDCEHHHNAERDVDVIEMLTVESVSCIDCDRTFRNTHALSVHRARIHPITPRPVPPPTRNGAHECPDCGATYPRAQDVGVHRARKHGYVSPQRERARRYQQATKNGRREVADETLESSGHDSAARHQPDPPLPDPEHTGPADVMPSDGGSQSDASAAAGVACTICHQHFGGIAALGEHVRTDHEPLTQRRVERVTIRIELDERHAEILDVLAFIRCITPSQLLTDLVSSNLDASMSYDKHLAGLVDLRARYRTGAGDG